MSSTSGGGRTRPRSCYNLRIIFSSLFTTAVCLVRPLPAITTIPPLADTIRGKDDRVQMKDRWIAMYGVRAKVQWKGGHCIITHCACILPNQDASEIFLLGCGILQSTACAHPCQARPIVLSSYHSIPSSPVALITRITPST